LDDATRGDQQQQFDVLDDGDDHHGTNPGMENKNTAGASSERTFQLANTLFGKLKGLELPERLAELTQIASAGLDFVLLAQSLLARREAYRRVSKDIRVKTGYIYLFDEKNKRLDEISGYRERLEYISGWLKSTEGGKGHGILTFVHPFLEEWDKAPTKMGVICAVLEGESHSEYFCGIDSIQLPGSTTLLRRAEQCLPLVCFPIFENERSSSPAAINDQATLIWNVQERVQAILDDLFNDGIPTTIERTPANLSEEWKADAQLRSLPANAGATTMTSSSTFGAPPPRVPPQTPVRQEIKTGTTTTTTRAVAGGRSWHFPIAKPPIPRTVTENDVNMNDPNMNVAVEAVSLQIVEVLDCNMDAPKGDEYKVEGTIHLLSNRNPALRMKLNVKRGVEYPLQGMKIDIDSEMVVSSQQETNELSCEVFLEASESSCSKILQFHFVPRDVRMPPLVRELDWWW